MGTCRQSCKSCAQTKFGSGRAGTAGRREEMNAGERVVARAQHVRGRNVDGEVRGEGSSLERRDREGTDRRTGCV